MCKCKSECDSTTQHSGKYMDRSLDSISSFHRKAVREASNTPVEMEKGMATVNKYLEILHKLEHIPAMEHAI